MNDDRIKKMYNDGSIIRKAGKIKTFHFNDKLELCAIINIRSGKCSEDCLFCAQSSHYQTNIDHHDILKAEEIIGKIKKLEEYGIKRVALVASGKRLSNTDRDKIVIIIEKIKKESSLLICASLGLINKSQAQILKRAGLTRYHHNLETAASFFHNVCTTHTYQERLETILSVKQAGLEICSGGIIGMGESINERIELAKELKALKVDSIPINILKPIKGTPFETMKIMNEDEIIRSLALFRVMNKTIEIRLAAGRGLLSTEKMLASGISGLMAGNYLTTKGVNIEAELEEIRKQNIKID